ncbi:MAG TPA: hypothetical protein PLZ43_15250 [bacterium]|nr:hypothetical protein [bacterium]
MIIAAIVLTVLFCLGILFVIAKVEDPDIEIKETKAQMFKGMAK